MNTETSRPRSRSLSLPARALRATRLALAFLTVVPLRWTGDEPDGDDLAASRFAYPVVGAVIGLVLAAASEVLRRGGVDPSLAAFLLVAGGVAVTGGLHLDGLADSFDGLFLWGGAERRLAVMRDPHVGSFGVAALVLVLLGKYAALASLGPEGSDRSLDLLASALVSRTLILVAAGSATYARAEGTGRFLIDATTRSEALGAAVAVPIVAAALAGPAGLAGSLAALALAWSLVRWARSRLGGITGDLLGAVAELGDVTFLVTAGLF